ncbi:MAG: ATP/GTP-binding protein [Rhodothermaceae bacterium]
MLLKFYCSNFKSIKKEISFSMFSGTYKRHENHIVDFKERGVLRSSAIYGTNGSGKTNILLALQFLTNLILHGTRDLNEKLNFPVFKLSNCEEYPTKMEIDFIIENKRYNYRIQIKSDIILLEELYEVKDDNHIVLFKRKKEFNNTKLTIAPNRKKTQKEKLREEIYAEELRDNQTFFFEGRNKKISEIDLPYTWFEQNLKFISIDTKAIGLASTFYIDREFFESSKKLIRNAKVGISDIKLTEYSLQEMKSIGFDFPNKEVENDLMDKNNLAIDIYFKGDLYSVFNRDGNVKFIKISTIHQGTNGNEVEFKYEEESKGVQRLFFLLPAIYRSIHKSEVFIIDEIETSFHPVLLKDILKLYFKSQVSNSGQIIFTTHESHLLDLDLFRQDEIWFCEKDFDGSTKLYSLSEFKPRFDKDIRKGYFEGQFGPIPFLGTKEQLL